MKKNATGILLIIASGLLWGMTGLFVRHMSSAGLSSLQIAFFRSAVAFPLLFLWMLFVHPKDLKIRLRDFWCFIGTGVCSLAFFNFCYFTAINLTSLSVAAILLYTEPAILTVISAILFKEKLNAKKLIALALTLAGCALVSGIFSGGNTLTLPGFLLGIGAGVGYALYSVFSRYALQRGYSSLTITTYTFLFCAIALAFVSDIPGSVRMISDGTFPWFWSCLLGIESMFAYLLYTKGLTTTENGTAAIMASIEPVTASLIGIVIYHEIPDFFTLFGILSVLAGIVIVNLKTKRDRT